MSAAAPTRPVLRYHGGKWLLAPWLISLFPEHRVYVEPFGGGGSVLMRKPRSYAEVYNDLDGDVVNVFRVLRNPRTAASLRRQLELTPYSREEFFACYEPVRSSSTIERARRRIVRSGMAFGTSSGKANRTGFRATPWRSGGYNGTDDWVSYPQALEAFTARLRGVCVEHRPAVEIIEQQDESEVLFYVDPPYPHSTRSAIRSPSDRERAYAHDMTDDEHRALAAVLRRVKGYVVLSGYRCDLYDRELYPDWESRERATLADGAASRTEVAWLNPRCAAALAGGLLSGVVA